MLESFRPLFMKLISFHNDDPVVPVVGKLIDLGKECNAKSTLISKPRISGGPRWHTPFVLTPCFPCIATSRYPPRAQISGFHTADSVQRICPERTILPYVERCHQAQHFEGLLALIHMQLFPPLLFSIIQPRQIALPSYSHNSCEQGPVLW